MVPTELGDARTLTGVRASAAALCDEDYPPVDGDYQNRTYFQPVALAGVLAAWRRTARLIVSGRVPGDVGLYIHWPFCPTPCAYCYCDRRAGADAAERRRGLDALLLELRTFAPVLRGVVFSQVQLYGGTPTDLGAAGLDRLFAEVRASFALRPDASLCVETSAATLDESVARSLVNNGVTRVDIGVDSLDAAVLARERRGQDERSADGALRLLLQIPGLDVGVALLFGLEGQTSASFVRDLGWVLRRRPRRILVYGFDPRPQTAFARSGAALDAPARERIARTVLATRPVLEAAGYRADESGWRPTSSLLGVGWSAMSRAFGSLWYQHPPLDGRPVADGAIPPFLGMSSSMAEEMRGYVVRGLFAGGRADAAGFRAAFARDMTAAPAVSRPARALERAGLARFDDDGLELTAATPALRARARSFFYSPSVRRALASRGAAGFASSGAPCLSYSRGDS
ncbi:MAG: radical SAM protein [Elusimicrobia bacterium]|nr:radical SAM protein [Elusimicrobiota bacterium]